MSTLLTFTRDLLEVLEDKPIHIQNHKTDMSTLSTFTHDLWEALEEIPIDIIGFHDCMVCHQTEWEDILGTEVVIPTVKELWEYYKQNGCIDWKASSSSGNVSMYMSPRSSSCIASRVPLR